VRRQRLILVDDEAEVRLQLRALLEAAGRAVVIGEASSGPELLEVLGRTRADAILLDLSMPNGDGFEALRALAGRPDHPPVVVLTMHDDAARVDRALALGAAGYVLKSARPAEICGAIQAAIDGGAFIQPSVARALLQRHLALAPERARSPGDVSPRQRELLRALGFGLGNKDIAHRLGIADGTVKSYLKDLYPRIGVSSRSGAVAWAIRHDVID